MTFAVLAKAVLFGTGWYRRTQYTTSRVGMTRRQEMRVTDMIECDIDIRTGSVAEALRRAGDAAPKGIAAAMKRIAAAVRKRAVQYAPRSPTQTILSKTLKRKRRTSQKTTPGGLEKSIRGETEQVSGTTVARIFVASNAPAGAYAKYIHDEKFKKWWKRGPGTVAKGAKADEKFVERAITDLQKHFVPIIEQELRRAMPSI